MPVLYDDAVVALVGAVLNSVVFGVFAADKISRRHFCEVLCRVEFLFNAHNGFTNAAV